LSQPLRYRLVLAAWIVFNVAALGFTGFGLWHGISENGCLHNPVGRGWYCPDERAADEAAATAELIDDANPLYASTADATAVATVAKMVADEAESHAFITKPIGEPDDVPVDEFEDLRLRFLLERLRGREVNLAEVFPDVIVPVGVEVSPDHRAVFVTAGDHCRLLTLDPLGIVHEDGCGLARHTNGFTTTTVSVTVTPPTP
jgi:hypothetical protein